MENTQEKILIIDEAGFSRICSAILETEGFASKTVAHTEVYGLEAGASSLELVITSYPYGATVLDELKKLQLPIILLTDHVSRDLIILLEGLEKTYCMIKPLDYQKFKGLVRNLMHGELASCGGYCIV